jgi:hypothetical protein
MPVYINPDFLRLPPGPRAVFEGDVQDSFFALPTWYDLMARHGVRAGTEIRLYTDEREDGGLAVLLQAGGPPSPRRLASLAGVYSVEHGLVRSPNADIAAGLVAILSEVIAERPRWESIRVAAFDARDPDYAALVRALRRAGMFVERVVDSGCWYEDTAGLDFRRFLAERPARLRNTFLRKRRKVEAGGRLTKAFCSDTVAIDARIADYQRVYAASWKPTEGFPGFIPALMRRAAALGALRLGIYYIGGVAAAAQFWIVWKGRAVIYKLAHDKEFDALSLGTLLTMEMFERVLAEDRPHEIDFGRGDDPYKQMWLPKRRERWGVTAANPRTLRGWRLGLHREAAKLYRLVRGR